MFKRRWVTNLTIYARTNITCSQDQVNSLSINYILECVAVEIITKHKHYVRVNCLYRKAGSSIDSFCENIEQIFGNIHKNKILFLCGNFNFAS